MNIAGELDKAIKTVCPIDGVSIGKPDDKATWRIDFAREATAQQRTAAQLVLEQFDRNVQETPDEPKPQIDKLVDLLEQKGTITTEEKNALFQGRVTDTTPIGK